MTAAENASAGPCDPASAAAAVLRVLAGRGQTLAVAESLTGGMVAVELTTVPGASRAFAGSVTPYATRLKHELLGVDDRLLAERGAVDPDVAVAMARGTRDRLGADWGLATTGVAGPDPQDGKPVGTVYIAAAGPGDVPVTVSSLTLPGDRAAVRTASAGHALALLLAVLTDPGAPYNGERRENGNAKDTEHPGSL